MLPSKLRSGQPFKASVVAKINEVIDYLKSQRLVSDNKTIKINQLSAGISISAIQNASVTQGATVSSFRHPFQLYLGTDENENQVLHIRLGFLEMTGSDQSRIAVAFEENESHVDQSLPLPDEAGQYIVMLFVWWDYLNEDSQLGWVYRVLYVPDATLPNEVMQNDGFFHIMLGNISVQENEDNELTYKISKQLVNSDFAVYDGDIKSPFKAYLSLYDTRYGIYPENGDVLDQELMPTKVVINWGKIYLYDKIIGMQPVWIELGQNPQERYYCLEINTITRTARIISKTLNEYVFTNDNKTYFVPVCRTVFNSNSLVGIVQYLEGNFCFSTDNGKVSLTRQDQMPDFLHEKIKYPVVIESALTQTESKIYTSNHQYIKGITTQVVSTYTVQACHKANNNGNPQYLESGTEITISGVYDNIYWDYAAIPGYNASSSIASNVNIQQLNNIDGELKWDEAYKIRVNKNDSSPDFLNAKILPGQEIYKNVTSDNTQVKIWTKKYIPGYNVSMEQHNPNTESCYAQVKSYKTLLTDGWGIDTDLTRKDSGFTLDYEVKLDEAVLSNLIVSTDDSIDVTWSSTSKKFDLKDKGKIRVNANDTIGYLPSKLDSDNDSITINPQSSYVSLEINPDYFQSELDSISIIERNDYLALDINTDFFQSSDDSIEISYNGDYLDFTATGKVRCTMFDDLDYLNTKINVDSSIASLIRLIKNAGEIKIANALQGTGLIAISNGNITVLPAPAGNAVLACSNGVFTWLPYSDCDFACQGSSSASE